MNIFANEKYIILLVQERKFISVDNKERQSISCNALLS